MSVTQLPENIEHEIIQSYRNKIIDGVLFIHLGFYLKNIEFMEHLNIKALKLQLCANVIPKLRSQTVKDLTLIYCKIKNLQEMELDNLESLFLQEQEQKLEDNTLTQSITKFQNLQKLRLDGYKNLDIKPLNAMKQLQTLGMSCCGFQRIDDIKELNQLKELIINNCGIVQFTALKYLGLAFILTCSTPYERMRIVNLGRFEATCKFERVKYSIQLDNICSTVSRTQTINYIECR
ncbi:Leucine-rich_repeat domain superfamily [Hexamita inflata]|uniref:Leucine-rich_repeat domain superfamily n=1 Tax=Hexamita inflata TaxID=28002 RepID=A0ABP1GSI0_9EUKA